MPPCDVLREVSSRPDDGLAVSLCDASVDHARAGPVPPAPRRGEGAYRTFWTLFGTANQLLAALTLLAISVWLRRTGRAYWYTAFPMAFVMTVTLWSLAVLARQPLSGWMGGAQPEMAVVLNGIVAFVLIGLAVVLLREGWRATQQEA